MVIHDEARAVFAGQSASDLYVAFVDILGFGKRVEANFDLTVNIYAEVLRSAELVREMRADVNVDVISDAFIVTSENLSRMIGVVQGLHMRTLIQGCLIRGGIGYGVEQEGVREQFRMHVFAAKQETVL